MTKMIPPVPTSAVMLPTPKQKIGFSIASIVGNDAHTVGSADNQNSNNNNNNNININNGENVGANENCKNNNNNNSSENNKNTIINNNNNKNNNHNQEHEQNDNHSIATTTSSPPQTPPAGNNNNNIVVGSTHMPTGVHLALSPGNPHQQQQQFHALPQHLTAVQQHALHQHLLLQHHHQQQQQQQQQQQLQQQLQQQQHQQQQHQSPKQHQDHIQDLLQRLHNTAAAAAHMNANFSTGGGNSPYSPPPQQTRLSPVVSDDNNASMQYLKRNRSPTPVGLENAQNPAQRMQPPHTPPKSVSPQSSLASSPPPLPSNSMPSAGPQFLPKGVSPGAGPLLMPGMPSAGLVRPFSMGPVGTPNGPPPSQQGLPDIKALPPYINAPPELPPQHNPHLFAAAQFQMAAALQAGHVLGPAAAAAAGLPPHASPFMPGPGMPRESYPLYPWLLSRHGRLFPHRFPGNFLLQPFRKPKRIRTAFSPSQLLKLEHAFESNQYVVGAERKALAQSLNLSETQVKVWFQNRRTKHKRMQQEDEKGGSSGNGSNDRNSQNNSFDDEDDDELIDMEMDDCPSEDEHELDASH